MQVALPELHAPVTLILDREQRLSDEEYLAFCEANPDLRLERTSRGEIIIVPPAGGESDYRCVEVAGQIREWSRNSRRGKAFGSSVEFILPDGAAFSPDAAWVSNERLASLSKAERKQFLRVVPEFIVKVMSPSDRLGTAREKMLEWIANGVDLGWLIDGDTRSVYVYRRGEAPRQFSGIDSLAGEGSVEGFALDLAAIWEGL
jgi:Uma2 family endonuclease